MQDSLPAGGLRLYREGVEPSGSLRKVSGYISILLSRTSPVARVIYAKVSARYSRIEDLEAGYRPEARPEVFPCGTAFLVSEAGTSSCPGVAVGLMAHRFRWPGPGRVHLL